MELFTLGIDLGKTTFHVVGMNQHGEVVLRKRFSRVQLLHFTANLKVTLPATLTFRLRRGGGPYIPITRLCRHLDITADRPP
jgi:hypothetical protein